MVRKTGRESPLNWNMLSNPVWVKCDPIALISEQTTPFLKQIGQFSATNSVTKWQRALHFPSCSFFLLRSQTHLTFPAPDHHGQSAINPPPSGGNQVTTPVRRVQESVAQQGERRRQLHYQQGKANRQPPPQPDRMGQTRPRQTMSGDPLTAAARSLKRKINLFWQQKELPLSLI